MNACNPFALIRKLRYLYHRYECGVALREAELWFFLFDTGYWRFNYAIAMYHARKMRKLR